MSAATTAIGVVRQGLAVLVPALAIAGQPREHRGLMLRLTLGPGYASASSTEVDGEVSGGALAFGVALGGALDERWVLYGSLVGYQMPEPNVRLAPSSIPAFSPDSEASATLAGLGVGLSRRFGSANAWLAAEAVFVSLRLDGPQAFNTGRGPGLRLLLGKEWWISDHWGLGAAAEALMGFAMSADSGGIGERERWNAIAGAALVSATYRAGSKSPEETRAEARAEAIGEAEERRSPPAVHTWPSFGFGLRAGPGALRLPEEGSSPAFGLSVRPGIHLTPAWSGWLDLRVAGANTDFLGTRGDPIGTFETTACARLTGAPLSLETGLGVAHIQRTLDQEGGDAHLRRTGIVVPLRVTGGWNLDNAEAGATMGLELTWQRYDTGNAFWILLPFGVEW